MVLEVVSDVIVFKEGDEVFGLVVGGGYVIEVMVNLVYLMFIFKGMLFFEVVGLVEVFFMVF